MAKKKPGPAPTKPPDLRHIRCEVTEETHGQLRALAAQVDVPLSVFVRDVLAGVGRGEWRKSPKKKPK